MGSRKDVIWRIYIVFIVMGIMCVAIISKVFAIQNSDKYHIVEKAKKQQIQAREIKPIRGSIYSVNGEVLATSDPVFDLFWDATVADDALFDEKLDSLGSMLASLLTDRSPDQWKQYLLGAKRDGNRYVKIATRVSRRDYRKISSMPIFRLGQFKGGLISIETDKRERQYSPLADRAIGYTRMVEDEDGNAVMEGKVGIEHAFNTELAGVTGVRMMRKSGKVWIPVDDEYIVRPENGKDVYTTIDVNIQDVAEKELITQLREQGAEHGCAIVMEVETGYIRAMANLSRTEEGGYYELYNHAIGSSTEPGSTFKLASLMVALEDGVIDLDHIEDTEDGTHQFYEEIMRDSRIGGYGAVSTVKAFAVSSNVWFSKVINAAYKHNPQKYLDGVKSLLDGKTDIALAGEESPYIKDADDEYWSGVSLPWMSIGYETKFTPLQILTFYNAVANDGVKLKPQIVREIRSNGEVVKSFSPHILDPRICSPSTIKKAKVCLEAVVGDSEDGTGQKLQSANFKIAGKTGTTQLATGNLGYRVGQDVKYQASFCGYFPADKPKYSCIVVIAAPEKQKYGAEVAGTVFKKIADKVFVTNAKYHAALNTNNEEGVKESPIVLAGYFPELKRVLKSIGVPVEWSGEKDEWIMSESAEGKVMVEKRYIGNTTMPNVIGMGVKDALYILENRGLQVSLKGSGKIVSQSIPAGKTFNINDAVEIILR